MIIRANPHTMILVGILGTKALDFKSNYGCYQIRDKKFLLVKDHHSKRFFLIFSNSLMGISLQVLRAFRVKLILPISPLGLFPSVMNYQNLYHHFQRIKGIRETIHSINLQQMSFMKRSLTSNSSF